MWTNFLRYFSNFLLIRLNLIGNFLPNLIAAFNRHIEANNALGVFQKFIFVPNLFAFFC